MKMLVSKLKHTRKIELILLDQNTAVYFWYKIIRNPHEATDFSVASGGCFHYYILKSGNEKVVCHNAGCGDQTH